MAGGSDSEPARSVIITDMKFAGLLVALVVFALGCNNASNDAPAEGGQGTPTASGGNDAPAGGAFAPVQALFTARCVGCHGENGKDGIDLRSYESAMKGGKEGPIIVAGDPANSLIVKAVKGEGGVDRMPKMGSPLSAEEIATIETWIKDGAKS